MACRCQRLNVRCSWQFDGDSRLIGCVLGRATPKNYANSSSQNICYFVALTLLKNAASFLSAIVMRHLDNNYIDRCMKLRLKNSTWCNFPCTLGSGHLPRNHHILFIRRCLHLAFQFHLDPTSFYFPRYRRTPSITSHRCSISSRRRPSRRRPANSLPSSLRSGLCSTLSTPLAEAEPKAQLCPRRLWCQRWRSRTADYPAGRRQRQHYANRLPFGRRSAVCGHERCSGRSARNARAAITRRTR